MGKRVDGRLPNEMRALRIQPGFIQQAEGSVLIEVGLTRVICTARVEDGVPPFMRNSGRGWVTAEYGMLPGSGNSRIARESARGKVGGRTHEIQRLIGRSLRAVTRLDVLGERTIWIDCDVIEADGGTRTASITGAYVAFAIACRKLEREAVIAASPLRNSVAAVSVGIVDGAVLVDLCYHEDSRAEVDMNIVMTGDGRYVEVQGTAESQPFTGEQLVEMNAAAATAIRQLTLAQHAALD